MLNKELILDKQDVNELLPAGEDRKPFYHRTMNCVSFRSSDFPIRIIDESRHQTEMTKERSGVKIKRCLKKWQ